MAEQLNNSPLGKVTDYISRYEPGLLYPIARSQSRQNLPSSITYHGVDVWTAYELSWLNTRGLPQVAAVEFQIPANSDNIVESKSFKLYLNSLNQTRFASSEAVSEVLERDLSAAVAAPVSVDLFTLSTARERLAADFTSALGAETLDTQDIDIDSYQPQPDYLQQLPEKTVEVSLCSDLLKTNCPVTGQPDWASVWIAYRGQPIDRAGLLRYLVSFRQHQDFHEHCVERIYCDLLQRCAPESLTVYARYTRRGGLDINPFRSTDPEASPPVLRLWRQ